MIEITLSRIFNQVSALADRWALIFFPTPPLER
jgi:hypothetical protein